MGVTVRDLVAFVLARLDENEVNAQSSRGRWQRRVSNGVLDGQDRGDRLRAGARRIIELHQPLWPDEGEPSCRVCGDPQLDMLRAPWPCLTVLAIAEQFADHPGFDRSWTVAGQLRDA
jgi:hypothetical protein